MRVDIVSREYPPEVYGGAGVHVAELVRALRDAAAVEDTGIDVRVRAFGAAREEPETTGYAVPEELSGANGALQALGTDLVIADDVAGANIVHSHTWYANFAGHLASLLHGIPHVVTAHSLEPLRPWKAEQLGGGYEVTKFLERTAYLGAAAVVAVSEGMRRDIIRSYPELDASRVHVIYNGIDTAEWFPERDDDLLRELGIDPNAPSVVFVGRITRQKGLPYLLRAVRELPEDVQLILCAGAPDTPELLAEVTSLVEGLRAERSGIVWIDRILDRRVLRVVLSSATTFVCPSVYEPLGIVNLEAMACGTAVVGTATGGIPEVVADGRTGRLVPIEQVQDGTGTPVDPERFVADLAAALIDVVSRPARAAEYGEAGRARAVEEFSWARIADQTAALYRELAPSAR